MKHTIKLPKPRTENGFVLVTSLIFLVVITLLAVSAISSSTLQERMASNLREKSQARQAADAALRAAELRLSPAVTSDNPQKRACSFDRNSDNNVSPNNPNTLVICEPGVFEGDGEADYFDPTIWDSDSPAIQTYSPPAASGGSSTPAPTVLYIIEDIDECESSVLVGVCGTEEGDEQIYYRITAFASGANPAAIAVTQSIYERILR